MNSLIIANKNVKKRFGSGLSWVFFVLQYRQDSAGDSSSTKTITFDEAGKQIVDYNMTVSATDDYWTKLYIDNPNHQWFDPIEFHVNCTP